MTNYDKHGLLYKIGEDLLRALQGYKSSSIEDNGLYDENVCKKIQTAFNAISKQMKKVSKSKNKQYEIS